MKYENLIEHMLCESSKKKIKWNDTGLYRGVESDFVKNVVREDGEYIDKVYKRGPRDSHMAAHLLYNKFIEYCTGYKNVRNKCIFATKSKAISGYYGDIYKVYVPNDTIFIYSKKIKDAYEHLREIMNEDFYEMEQAEEDLEIDYEYFLKNKEKREIYFDSLINRGIKYEAVSKTDDIPKKSEVMILCKKYRLTK